MSKSAFNKAMQHAEATTPESVYQSRQSQHSAERNRLERLSDRIASARGLLALFTLLIAWLCFIQDSLHNFWLFVPLVAFLALVVTHNNVVKHLDSASRAVAYYTRRQNQLAGHWQGQGNTGLHYCDDNHPYSSDLDIFGEGSLFELISCARTRLGEETLAQWFTSGAELKTVKQRQLAIDELRTQVDFREQMALLKSDKLDAFDRTRLQQWVKTPTRSVRPWQRIVATVLGSLAALSVVAWATGFGAGPILIVVLLEIAFYATSIKHIHRMAAETDEAGSGLEMISQVLALVENKSFKAPLLEQLHSDLQTQGHTPSWQINQLHRLIQTLNNCLKNQVFAPVAFLFGIPIHVMHRIECWQEQVGSHLPSWFDALGQVEALSSLACYAFENPNDPFPELVDHSEEPYVDAVFDAENLGHPLIAQEHCVRNTIRIDAKQSLIMVSGSNMSGKSTLLRTIGVNLVLALSGAPVKADKLKTSRFLIGSVMRAHDSLQQGASLFYAVISRIKQVVEQAGQSTPLLFLFDEILQGTNSHDRRIGAESIIHQLIKQHAVGLVTTHDLALTAIVDSLGTKAINIHFEDHLVDGQLRFDYKIRTGPVQKSNALELMRMIGLEVSDTHSN
jgi:MutS domain V